MVGMATWEDGPEYAPLERPSDFCGAAVGPLEIAPPVPQLAALAPKSRPQFNDPSGLVAPLATLIPVVEDVRNPSVPFEVVSSTVTSMEASGAVAWGAAHWSAPTGPPTSYTGPPGSYGGPPVGEGGMSAEHGAWGPPSGTRWLDPQTPLAPSPGTAISPTGFPSPGTPQWFAPGRYGEDAVPAPVDVRSIGAALTPGLIITLVIGGFFFFLAPITLVIGYVLSSRVKVARPAVRKAMALALGGLGFFAVIGALSNNASFGDWWAFVGLWGLAISWGTLIAVIVIAYRSFKNPPPPAPGYTSHWG